MLPDKDVRITVRPAQRPGEFLVTVSHAPTGVITEGTFRGPDNEQRAIREILRELQKNVAFHQHLASKGRKPWA